jgi:hypothetical protein
VHPIAGLRHLIDIHVRHHLSHAENKSPANDLPSNTYQETCTKLLLGLLELAKAPASQKKKKGQKAAKSSKGIKENLEIPVKSCFLLYFFFFSKN